jgi:hypothetical protein
MMCLRRYARLRRAQPCSLARSQPAVVPAQPRGGGRGGGAAVLRASRIAAERAGAGPFSRETPSLSLPSLAAYRVPLLHACMYRFVR